MNEARFTLLGDGTSDKSLIPIIHWVLSQYFSAYQFTDQFADLSRLGRKPKSLKDRISRAVDLYPCEILFVHRDAETEPSSHRSREVEAAFDMAMRDCKTGIKCIPVVPVRMTEAWLLTDERAIRQAAGNSGGSIPLDLPRLSSIERIADPKELLKDLLAKASQKKGRNLRKMNLHKSIYFVSEFTVNWDRLRNLPSFIQFEQSISALASQSIA